MFEPTKGDNHPLNPASRDNNRATYSVLGILRMVMANSEIVQSS